MIKTIGISGTAAFPRLRYSTDRNTKIAAKARIVICSFPEFISFISSTSEYGVPVTTASTPGGGW